VLAGDGGVLAYGVSGAVEVVDAHSDSWYGEVLSRSAVPVTGISVDGSRIATLYRDGTVTVTSSEGDLVSRFTAGPALAIALREDTVVVLRSGHLDVYDAETGRLTHSWSVPAAARSVSLHYGIAVIAAGGDVYAMNVQTGRTTRLLHVHGRAAAQLGSPGAIVQFNLDGRGYLRLIPMSTIEARTR
jgi:outer membrane protein assembly factor BamB